MCVYYFIYTLQMILSVYFQINQLAIYTAEVQPATID